MAFFNVACGVQAERTNLDLHVKKAFELVALNYGFSLKSHIPQISQLIFGKDNLGFIILTKKIMRHSCKTALHLEKNSLVFYTEVLHQFDENIVNKASTKNFIHNQSKSLFNYEKKSPSKMLFLQGLCAAFFVTLLVSIYLSHNALEEEVDKIIAATNAKTYEQEFTRLKGIIAKQTVESELQRAAFSQMARKIQKIERSLVDLHKICSPMRILQTVKKAVAEMVVDPGPSARNLAKGAHGMAKKSADGAVKIILLAKEAFEAWMKKS